MTHHCFQEKTTSVSIVLVLSLLQASRHRPLSPVFHLASMLPSQHVDMFLRAAANSQVHYDMDLGPEPVAYTACFETLFMKHTCAESLSGANLPHN